MDERFLINHNGDIFYSSTFLVSKSTPDGRKEIASFSTTFAISLGRINAIIKGGEGLAFLIASSDGGPPPDSYGGFIGLSNGSTKGNSSNGFATVEFETAQQEHNIDDNHVGLDVNSVQSVCAMPLGPMGFNLSDGTSLTVTIDYDESSRNVSVSLSNDLENKPAATVLQSPLDLSRIILGREAYFGFVASTGVR
ncbi:hypothetical protein ZWY2020_003349 [Hordeum vulgare]|nr:hypothetical protein ZWY2020_003349 [Hordeum vulgare]